MSHPIQQESTKESYAQYFTKKIFVMLVSKHKFN